MGTPSDELTKLRGLIGKAANGLSAEGAEAAGNAGEFLTEKLLDVMDLGWIKTVQHENMYSGKLRNAAVARPDYLVRIDDRNFLLDAKNRKPSGTGAGHLGFALTAAEHRRLAGAQAFFGLPVIVAMWDRGSADFTYAWLELAEFSNPLTIDGKPCLEAAIPAGSFSILPL